MHIKYKLFKQKLFVKKLEGQSQSQIFSNCEKLSKNAAYKCASAKFKQLFIKIFASHVTVRFGKIVSTTSPYFPSLYKLCAKAYYLWIRGVIRIVHQTSAYVPTK